MYNELLHCLETNESITDNLFGFRKAHLLKLLDEISNEFTLLASS